MLRSASVLLSLVVCGWTLRADETGLVRVGEDWRYLTGKGEASSPPAAWRQLNFDDAAWPNGPSGFGYANIGIATELRDMPFNYLSLFLRKTFLLNDPGAVKWLVLRLDYDDGFVAYLNGEEIARRGLSGRAGEPVPFDAPADYHSAGAAEEIDVSVYTNLLMKGENVLAIQAHNSSADSFSFAIIPEFLANFQRGPFVQNASSNQIQVIWKTPVPSDTKVEFGIDAALDRVHFDTNAVITHAPTLTNLLPDTIYFYRVSSSSDDRTAASPIQSFRTLKPSGPLCFAVFGDSGWGSAAQYQIARVVQRTHPDLVLHTGDVIYTVFTAALADTRCLSVYAAHMKSTPYFFAIGNHDILAGAQHVLEAFYLPTNSVPLADHQKAGTSPEHYYSFDHGDAHFVVLFIPYLSQYKLTVGDAQYNWLTNDLATTRKPWKILTYHVAMNTSSGHRFDDNNYNQVYDRLEIREVLLPVASRYGVQLMLNGHDHGYERFNPTNGVHSITTAGGGVPLYSFTALDAADAFFWARFNCLKVTIAGDTLEAQALGVDGQVFDSMTIQRTLPEAKLYQALWHTPAIETGPPDDGQGNISGQTFDFQGPAIPTLTGKFSNLGRVFVNNDQTNLYVGFDRVMIYGNNNIFLFIESPRLPGVTNLIEIGNGLLDPAGQGADGLDFLSNLSFTNFAPNIGCILGDEFGDGQFRSFLRTNLALNIGQGVFKLDPEISEVPGVRLQQFNMSPQIGGMIGEENANFIKIAIPLSELGPLRPGDTIKIGAVVGGEAFSATEAGQTRLLDDGGLGSRLMSSGQGPAILEGTSVRLALDPQRDEEGDGVSNEREILLGTNPWNPDSDGDGLPDGWEIAHQLDPLSATGEDGANGDPDQDNFPNALESLAGTDPLDPGSLLRLDLKLEAERKSRISWSAVVGKKYELEYADYPFTNFVSIPGANFPRIATTNLESFQDELPSTTALPIGRLYRVHLIEQ